MLAAASLARTGATMVGLTMGFVAYEQTESALIVAIVVSAFGLAFALASLVAGHVLQHVGLRGMLVGALVFQIAGALVLASVTSRAGADVVWLTIFGFSNGLASALLFLGSQMLLHGLASGDHLQRVVSLDAAGASISRIAGPALGGVLLAVIGTHRCSSSWPSCMSRSLPSPQCSRRASTIPNRRADHACEKRLTCTSSYCSAVGHHHRGAGGDAGAPVGEHDAGGHRITEPRRRRPARHSRG
jgi:MFS family permease